MGNINNIELLSPAGDSECLQSALDFGADAVYLAGKKFGMRTSSANFDTDNLRDSVKKAHDKGVKVYLTCNTVARNGDIDELPEFLEQAQDCGVDAFIIADIGVMSLAQKYAPKVHIHISTQAGIANYQTANVFYNMGAKRVVLARELSLEEIAELHAKVPNELEIEAFVHGSMCVSFSGRCLMSSYMTGRDANLGDCAQPCRWKYYIYEPNREGQFFPILPDDNGTYLFNSRDLCMIEHIPELVNAGVTSLKIEGRAKSSYYTAVITNAYRHAIDDYRLCGSNDYKVAEWILEEMEKVSHREYNTGFFFGKEPGQIHSNGGYIRNYEVVAVCGGFEDGAAYITQRNRFFKGDLLDVLPPGGKPFNITVNEMFDEYGQAVDVAPHAMQKLKMLSDTVIPKGSLLRKKLNKA